MFHLWHTKHLAKHHLVSFLWSLNRSYQWMGLKCSSSTRMQQSVRLLQLHAFFKQDADHFICVQLDVWMLDPFQIKTLTCGIKPPTLLPTTQGIRVTYFSINKDTDNSGGLLAAVVASS